MHDTLLKFGECYPENATCRSLVTSPEEIILQVVIDVFSPFPKLALLWSSSVRFASIASPLLQKLSFDAQITRAVAGRTLTVFCTGSSSSQFSFSISHFLRLKVPVFSQRSIARVSNVRKRRRWNDCELRSVNRRHIRFSKAGMHVAFPSCVAKPEREQPRYIKSGE